jgi:hypothetical protein
MNDFKNQELNFSGHILVCISKILPSVNFILSVINLIKWPIKSRDS